jgi:hypothetical protein
MIDLRKSQQNYRGFYVNRIDHFIYDVGKNGTSLHKRFKKISLDETTKAFRQRIIDFIDSNS